MSSNQFRFRKHKDTTQANLKIINTVIAGLNKGVYSACIFLDYSKAFDTVCHALLLKKLELYGVRGHALSLLVSYLSNRKQHVYVNYSLSNTVISHIGVPQGSCLGPLLYLIYTNDINYLLKNTNVVLFADDTAVAETSTSPALLLYSLNYHLRKILDWSNFNKLSINFKKTKWIYFTNRVTVAPKLYLNGTEIECLQSFKYLGFHIDSELSFKTHIKYIKSRLSRFSYLSKKLRPCLTIESARNMYYGLVHSIVSYGVLVWGGIFIEGASARQLCALQDRIIFNLFSNIGENRNDISCVYKRSNILTFADLYRVKTCVFVYKILKENSLPFLYDEFASYVRNHHYELRNPNEYLTPFPTVRAIKLNFMYRAICEWNALNENLKSLPNSKRLKIAYTDCLLNSY